MWRASAIPPSCSPRSPPGASTSIRTTPARWPWRSSACRRMPGWSRSTARSRRAAWGGHSVRFRGRLCAGRARHHGAATGPAHARRLARHPALRFGLTHEFLGRADGWPGGPPLRAAAAPARARPRHRLRGAGGRAGRRHRHLLDRCQDPPLWPARAAGRPRLLSALRRGGAVPLDVPRRFPRARQALQVCRGASTRRA